jgi:exonuclease III
VVKKTVATEEATETHIVAVVADKAAVTVCDVKTTQVPTADGALAIDSVTAVATTSTLSTPLAPEGPGPMIDTWRKLHPDDEHYTYFSYRFNARQKGIGWRLDHCE